MKRIHAAGVAPTLALLVTIPLAAVDRDERPVLEISTFARAMQPGEVVRLEVRCTCPASREPASARVFGADVPLVPVPDAPVWQALIGIDIETVPGKYPVTVVVARPGAPPLTGTHTLAVTAKRFPTRRLNVAAAYVNPPADALERISREAQRMRALFEQVTPRLRVGPFQAPVRTTATKNFGARSIFNGQPRSPHAGVDFTSEEGTPIVAPAAAAVVLVGDLFFTGRTVILDHGRGLYSVLAHLSETTVTEGEAVEGGAVVGAVGATGRATGPHLHWSTRLNGARVDPLSLLEIVASVE